MNTSLDRQQMAPARQLRAWRSMPNILTVLGALGLLLAPTLPAQAWILTITPGTRAVYMQVGNGTANADNTTINEVSLNLPAAAVGSGVPQAMTSNSTQSISFYDNYVVCNPPAQVYVGGFFRQPTTTAQSAVMQVTTPANLTSGANTIPFTRISWTSTANGDPTPHIPAGTFNGATLFLVNVPSNRWLENCHVFSYSNAAPVAAGTYTGRATYTLTAP